MVPNRARFYLDVRGTMIALVAVFTVLVTAWPAVAQQLFTVRNISVDETADTAANARRIAIAKGQRTGADRLLHMLTRKRDWGLLPSLDDTTLQGLVRGFEVQQEKTSATRYLAYLTVHFNQPAVRTLLRQAGVPFTETASKPYLILPVYEVAGTRVLWDEPNPWKTAWSQSENIDSVVPLIVPAGDLQDVVSISASQALSGDEERMNKLAHHYGIDQTLVAHAIVDFALGSGEPSVHVTTFRYGVAGERMATETFRGGARDELPRLLAQAVSSVRTRIEEEWKNETILSFDRQERISLNIPLESLHQWVDIRQRLSLVAEIKDVELAAITKADAQAIIHYFGDTEKLRVALSQRDLVLSAESGFWVLRPRVSQEQGNSERAASP